MKPEEILAAGTSIVASSVSAVQIVCVVATVTGLSAPALPVAGIVAAGGLIGFGVGKALECFNSPQN
jgi:hypothetical protein